MNVSNLFFALRIHFECSGDITKCLTAYQDKGGIWTIGMGTTYYPDGSAVREGDTCTEEQAYEYARFATAHIEATVNATTPNSLNNAQFDAICDFAYNAGIGAWEGSTLRKLISTNPDDPAIINHWLEWDKGHVNGQLVEVPGLLRRRNCEFYLYKNGVNHPMFFE